jgi:glycine/D-amino acid oxidase-like deaminating enzyme/nitrite reductase/ring-hydroxylating ferredoxin subunit
MRASRTWCEHAELPKFGPLRQHVEADVCVVGGGIAGLMTAYGLAREGRHVVVLEREHLGAGETGRTTAHLVTALDRGYASLRSVLGLERARLAAESHRRAIESFAEIVVRESIACDFRRLDGYLFRGEGCEETFENERAAMHEVGLPGIELVSAPPGCDGIEVGPCLRVPNQAQFQPLAFLGGLATALGRLDCRIFEGTTATEVGDGRVVTDGGAVRADAIVVATNAPINSRVGVPMRQAAYQTYVVAAVAGSVTCPPALFWDVEDPFHYVRYVERHGMPDVVLIGGEDHKTGQDDGVGADERHARLEAWGRRHFPAMEGIVECWSGEVMESLDGLGLIGRLEPKGNVYVVSGDSGNGFTHAGIAGFLLRDLVLGRESPYASLYDPHRLPLKAIPEVAREGINAAAQYATWLAPADVADVDAIPYGGGAVLRKGTTKVAVHRDERGELHACSAVCPHLGCIVDWNADERTWDCPCHGSRFDALGRVLHGPANRDLEPSTP